MNNKTINCTVLPIIGKPLVGRHDKMTQDKHDIFTRQDLAPLLYVEQYCTGMGWTIHWRLIKIVNGFPFAVFSCTDTEVNRYLIFYNNSIDVEYHTLSNRVTA